MTLLLIPTIWILGLAIVAGLCVAARRGDSALELVSSRAKAANVRASDEARLGSRSAARRAGGSEHDEFVGAGRAAA